MTYTGPLDEVTEAANHAAYVMSPAITDLESESTESDTATALAKLAAMLGYVATAIDQINERQSHAVASEILVLQEASEQARAAAKHARTASNNALGRARNDALFRHLDSLLDDDGESSH